MAELIAAAKGGSDSALGRALTECQPRLLQVARKRLAPALRPIVGASDIVQDTFVNATKAFRVFRGNSGSQFLNWLSRILSNRIAQIVRRDGRLPRSGIPHFPGNAVPQRLNGIVAKEQASPSSIASDEEQAKLIRAGLTRLCDRDQQVLQLRIGDRLNFVQIGQRMESSEDAARMQFGRAVKRLRGDMQDASIRKTAARHYLADPSAGRVSPRLD
jgi:RNA polymerase sigma-70 factor (ECF subfamily)